MILFYQIIVFRAGLTLLLPYILSTRRAWAACPLRVFTLANKHTEMELEERKLVHT